MQWPGHINANPVFHFYFLPKCLDVQAEHEKILEQNDRKNNKQFWRAVR